MQLNDGETKQCVIYKALYVPKLACNLKAADKCKSKKFCDRNVLCTTELAMFVGQANW